MKKPIFRHLRSVFGKNPGPESHEAEPITAAELAANDDVSFEDFPITITRTSGARAGEVHVMSTKLMDARLSTVRALMEVTHGRLAEARSELRRAMELVRPYRGPIDQETLDLIVQIAEWSAKFEDMENASVFFQRAVDAAFARFWAAKNPAEAQQQTDAILKSGVSFDSIQAYSFSTIE